MINKNSKVVCCCSGGQVRSVAARGVLMDKHGLHDVLTCGLDKNGTESLKLLFAWADCILVVGEKTMCAQIPDEFSAKVILLPVGPDRWGNCFDGNLRQIIKPLLAQLINCISTN